MRKITKNKKRIHTHENMCRLQRSISNFRNVQCDSDWFGVYKYIHLRKS